MASKFSPVCVALAVSSLGLLSTAKAIDFNWNGSVDNAWLTPGNWTPAGPPAGGDGNFARYFSGTPRSAAITADVPVIQDILTANDGTVGTRQIDHSAGNVTLNGWLRTGVDPDGAGALTGAGDAGVYNLTGGTLSAGSYRIAEVTGSTSTLNVSGGTFLQRTVADPADGNSWNRIGDSGVATVNLSGTGLISLDARTLVGAGTSSAGTVINQTGGTFEIRHGELTLADSGTNTLYNISGGTLRTLYFHQDGNFGGNITVGEWNGSNAKLTVGGTATVSAATNVVIGLGNAANPAKGAIEQAGGTFTFGGNGQLTTGTGGALENRSFGGLFMSTDASSQSSFTISGGTFRQNDMTNVEDQGAWNHIGQNGPATFNLSGTGLVSFASRTHIASGATANATVNQTGGTFEVRNHELIIGDSGTATYNISAGILQTARNVNVGNWNNGNGNLNVSGSGQVLVGQGMIIGQTENGANTSQGKVTQTGGLVRVQGDVLFGNGNASTTTAGRYDLNGGTLDMTGGNFNKGTGTAAFNFTNGRLQELANYNIGDLSQAGGTLAPGPTGGVGTTTINGNYSLLAPGTIELSIVNATTFDAVNVNGTVSLAGNLTLVDTAGSIAQGSGFTILNNDGADPISGFFAGKPQGAVFAAGGVNYQISYTGGDGNDVRLLVVPEPASILALLGGMAVLVGRRRQRRF